MLQPLWNSDTSGLQLPWREKGHLSPLCGKYASHIRKKFSLDSIRCRAERLAQQASREKISFVPVLPEKYGADFEV